MDVLVARVRFNVLSTNIFPSGQAIVNVATCPIVALSLRSIVALLISRDFGFNNARTPKAGIRCDT
jgi:hypothetical protein